MQKARSLPKAEHESLAEVLPSMTVIQQRVIRVFVSSTFRDMQAEREELVKRVFPQLRKLCEERGVTWSEVDLRWGITEEQTERGEVLPICLAEIQRCRPYFIGLLGERYGWVPEEIPDGLIDQEPWLAEHLHHSVTELEILHGVLNDPTMADHALFYFRDRAFIDSLPPVEQPYNLERPTKEEIERLGHHEAERHAHERRQKLAALKAHIISSGLPVRENYPNPQALGELVLRDLTEVIDGRYPKGSEPDPLDREALDHELFAQSRAKVYIGRQSYYDRLDEHARGAGPALVVLGESGSGKSALLSNWALRYRSAHPEEMLLMHFIGATPFSADWAAMLRRVVAEFKRRFDIQQEIPEDPDELRAAFANWLYMAAARGKVVLILDALDKLEDRDAAPDLVWLPPEIPPNVRLIISTLPGRPLDALTKRGWSTLKVTLLQTGERLKLLWKYLRQYSKRLNKPRRRRIAIAEQSSNPLYLRALLDELRVFGVHEELDSRIEHYLTAMTADKLYEKILERYERDYERDRPRLVRDAMSLLWAARRGLSETELLELLGENSEPLPRAHWSPLYLAAESSLVSRSGLMNFAHDYVRQAVRDKYLPTEQDQQEAHLRLADYFEAYRLPTSVLALPGGQEVRFVEVAGLRKIDEMPWHLAEAKSWQRLCDVLTDPQFFTAAWDAAQFDVKAYWAKIEADSPVRLVDAYRAVLQAPGRDTNYTRRVGSLLEDTGHPEEALLLGRFLFDHFRRTGDDASLKTCLGPQARIHYMRGDLDEAEHLFKEEERISRELNDQDGLRASLGGQAVILKARGKFEDAMRLHKEAERICRELGNKDGLQASLGNQGLILYLLGRFDEAIRLDQEQERICRELGNQYGLQACLVNQALILHARGELDEAMRLLDEQERICRELGNKHGLQAGLGEKALILYDRGKLDEAMRLHKEEEQICRELGDKLELSRSLGNQARIFADRGELDEAMRLHKEEERICRELGNSGGLQSSLAGQGLILRERGELDEAMRLLKEAERICRELGDNGGLQACLGNQALILADWGELDEAMRLHKEEERICRELGDKYGLQSSICNQALILKEWGELDEAMRLHKEEERICRELGNKESLATSLANQAVILKARGELDEAMSLHREQERICRELGNKHLLAMSLGGQGVILSAQGELDEAMRLYREAERMLREPGNKDGLQITLGHQANIFWARGELVEAMRLYKEQERICAEMDNKDGLARSLIMQAQLLGKINGRSHEGLPLAEKAYRIASDHGFTALAQQIERTLDSMRLRAAKIEAPPSPPVHVPIPHPGANAERAAQLNAEYQRELARWNSLPWLKRVRTTKPEPPRGI